MNFANHRITINSPAGVALLGLCALAVGLVMAQRTASFVARAVPATCTVDSAARRSFTVWCTGDDHLKRYVNVRHPWLAAPWSYLRGQKVAILLEPDAFDSEIDSFALIFSGPPARIHSALHIWTPAVCVLGAGLALLTFGAWSALSRGRFRTSVSLALGTELQR